MKCFIFITAMNSSPVKDLINSFVNKGYYVSQGLSTGVVSKDHRKNVASVLITLNVHKENIIIDNILVDFIDAAKQAKLKYYSVALSASGDFLGGQGNILLPTKEEFFAKKQAVINYNREAREEELDALRNCATITERTTRTMELETV